MLVVVQVKRSNFSVISAGNSSMVMCDKHAHSVCVCTLDNLLLLKTSVCFHIPDSGDSRIKSCKCQLKLR